MFALHAAALLAAEPALNPCADESGSGFFLCESFDDDWATRWRPLPIGDPHAEKVPLLAAEYGRPRGLQGHDLGLFLDSPPPGKIENRTVSGAARPLPSPVALGEDALLLQFEVQVVGRDDEDARNHNARLNGCYAAHISLLAHKMSRASSPSGEDGEDGEDGGNEGAAAVAGRGPKVGALRALSFGPELCGRKHVQLRLQIMSEQPGAEQPTVHDLVPLSKGEWEGGGTPPVAQVTSMRRRASATVSTPPAHSTQASHGC